MVTGVRQKEIIMKKNGKTEIDAIIDSLPEETNFLVYIRKKKKPIGWTLLGPH